MVFECHVSGCSLSHSHSLHLYSYRIRVRFSLVLVDDLAPALRRPLSPFSAGEAALHERMASTIHQAVASTVGPNRFVITIADTPHSWLAFQVRLLPATVMYVV